MVHPRIVAVMQAVLRERGISLGDRNGEEECLAIMIQRVQETSGLRLIPWLTGEECREAAVSRQPSAIRKGSNSRPFTDG